MLMQTQAEKHFEQRVAGMLKCAIDEPWLGNYLVSLIIAIEVTANIKLVKYLLFGSASMLLGSGVCFILLTRAQTFIC